MVKNHFKKLVSLTLAAVMLVGASVTTFATEGPPTYNLTILEDSDTQKVTQTSDNAYVYITTFDKINNTMQFTTINKSTNTKTVGAEISREDAGSVTSYSNATTRSASLNEKTFTNYEYTKAYGSTNTWTLRRPDGSLTGTIYFKTYEVSQNRSYINTFKSAVDTINTKEGEIVASYGIVVLSDIAAAAISAGAIATGGALSPAAWTAIVAAAGANTACVAVCVSWNNACNCL